MTRRNLLLLIFATIFTMTSCNSNSLLEIEFEKNIDESNRSNRRWGPFIRYDYFVAQYHESGLTGIGFMHNYDTISTNSINFDNMIISGSKKLHIKPIYGLGVSDCYLQKNDSLNITFSNYKDSISLTFGMSSGEKFQISIEAFNTRGESLGIHKQTSKEKFNLSANFNNQPISRIVLRGETGGLSLGSIQYKNTPFPDLKLAECIDKLWGYPLSPTNQLAITSLDFRGKCIKDIKGMEVYSNLNTLKLRENIISDITPLNKLTKLKRLELLDNSISSISPLIDLESLEYLSISGNRQLTDDKHIEKTFMVIKSLPNLKVLHLNRLTIKDINLLPRHNNITSIGLGATGLHNKPTSTQRMLNDKFPNLENIYLYKSEIDYLYDQNYTNTTKDSLGRYKLIQL